ncbi:MAG: ECF transporter S component [Clostridia bacterium]|nr:ECF transporter S component [Clostridia bacterium]
MNNQKFFTTRNVVYLAVLTTLLVVLNLLGTVFKIVTNVNLTLIPIVLGALTLGVKGGFILGFISGLMTFIFGVTGLDPFTNFLFTEHPVLTFLICTVKITLGAVLGAIAYKLLKNKNKYLATFVSSAVVPVVNTLIFILGALLMSETISVLSSAEGVSVIYFLVIICAGVNFLIEFGINILVAPAIHTVIQVVDKQLI